MTEALYMIKLIAVDLDDTMINDQLEIPLPNIEAVDRVRQQGIRLVLATGRMHTRAMPYAQMLKLDSDDIIISYNGALVQKINGERLAAIPLEYSLALEIVEYCQAQGWTLNVYDHDQLYVARIDANVDYYMRMTGAEAHPVGDLVKFVTERHITPYKLLIVSSNAQENARDMKLIQQHFGKLVQVTQSKQRYVEITHVAATKGNALAQVAALLGIDSTEVMAIGDGGNDTSMIRWAGIGVAMGNAAPAVQAAADFVTKSNNDAGVAFAIERFI